MASYTFRIGGPTPPVDAQIVGDELSRIEAAHGVIDPHRVLDLSRPVDAPLHGCFEWDDDIAAEKWRLEQSRNLIRSVEVVQSNAAAPTIGFINVQSKGGYVSASAVRSRPDLYLEALRSYRSRLEAAGAQLARLEELAPASERKRIKEDRRALERLAAA
jgi:hypothetical protein